MGRLRMTQTVVPLLGPSDISSGPLATEDPVQDETEVSRLDVCPLCSGALPGNKLGVGCRP